MMHDFPDDETGDVLRRMQKNGADLNQPRDIDFSIVFSDEEAALQFIDKVKNNFLELSYEKIDDSEGYIWDVTATKFMAPSYANITETEEFLRKESTAMGGKNDGWGCFTT